MPKYFPFNGFHNIIQSYTHPRSPELSGDQNCHFEQKLYGQMELFQNLRNVYRHKNHASSKHFFIP